VNAVEYLRGLPFPPDPFQVEAADAIDRGESVVVTAPTGSGKTVVAEAAIARALGRGRRAVYTTPLKALSNQKYGDLQVLHGRESVGLLTGDNSINGSAPVVVMTTEVLRNMMYADPAQLADVGVVILDEVHYLEDRARGAVWEEIIIHLDRAIPLVCLSATIANPGEFADWVGTRRGPTTLVTEATRPVPLTSTYLLKDRWEGHRLRLIDLFEGDLPNAGLVRMLRRHPGRRRYAPPGRTETCELLHDRKLLPAIYFIFSRAGCSAAARRVVADGVRLTNPDEAAEIRRIADARTAHLPPSDLAVLGYESWLHTVSAGVAPHHAGLVPAFKETAEYLFAHGLVRLVFATETLALGINMPARTVVLESLSKFTGESHEPLQPGDYTQLTGRAGRRGIDRRGTAVVQHSGYATIDQVAGIAASGSHPLRSSFRPTYNMAVNLIAVYPRERAEHLLNASFAQYRHERRRRQLQESIGEAESRLAAARRRAHCDRGDVWAAADDRPGDRIMAEFAASTAAGDVLEWQEGRRLRRHVVVARGHGKRPRLLLVSDEAELRRLAPDHLPPEATIAGRIQLGGPFRPRDPKYRRRIAEALATWQPIGDPLRPAPPPDEGPFGCPDIDAHLGAVREARRIERRLERDRKRLQRADRGLIPMLDARLALLQARGYVADWHLRPPGERLRFIYNELDLLLAECLEARVFEGLDPAETAALLSVFTYEPRAGAEPGRWPTAATTERFARIAEIWEGLARQEEGAGLTAGRPPETGFAELAYRWAGGEPLEDLFEDETGGVGDFVRNCRQLLDLLRQVRDLAPELASIVGRSVASIDRGVVAAVAPR
jgi:ATP-dependent RNA helicase HelY